MGSKIIDRGRGPEIEGTRITIYDVVDYWKEGWRYDQIAGLFRLPSDDIQAALQYIEEHEEMVMADYQRILEQSKKKRHTPKVEVKLAQNRRKFQSKVAESQSRRLTEAKHAGDHGGP